MIKVDYNKIIAELRRLHSYDKESIQKIAEKYNISFQLAEFYWNYRNEEQY